MCVTYPTPAFLLGSVTLSALTTQYRGLWLGMREQRKNLVLSSREVRSGTGGVCLTCRTTLEYDGCYYDDSECPALGGTS